MAGNSIGQLFRVTTFGESHGVALGGVVDGCPPGLPLNEADLQKDLDRRKPGTSSFTSARREPDTINLLSGVFAGKTTGTPIGLLINNVDQRPHDYTAIKDQYRPGHADYTYALKYGHRDYRGGGRASARETAIRVAAGAIAKKYLAAQGIRIQGYLAQLGPIIMEAVDLAEVDNNPFFCPDVSKIPALEVLVTQLKAAGDSIGAKIAVVATGVMPGLGEPVFDRMDADLAHALMSINAVKGVEIGAGFACVTQQGSEHRDELSPDGFLSNQAGGTLGGITTGQAIVVHLALKPTSSITIPGQSLDTQGKPVSVVSSGRHDPCVGIRAIPIAEAMMAIVLMDHVMRHRAQNADVITPMSIG